MFAAGAPTHTQCRLPIGRGGALLFMGRWLTVTCLGCDDRVALESLRALARDFGSTHEGSSLDLLVNVFNAGSTVSCAVLEALRSDEQKPYNATRLVGVRTIAGYKTAFWATLTPSHTTGYDFVWLRDSDVLVDAHLFSTREVEHWMQHTGASVAQPSVLPLEGRSKSHGWWTPFRAAFHASCVVSSSPIVEQMTPIFTRRAFDELRRHLAAVPPGLLTTDSGDFGLETFWCGLFDRPRPGAKSSTQASAPAAASAARGGTSQSAASHVPPSCLLLHHVSVVHADSRSMKRFAPARIDTNPWSNGTLGRGLRNHLIDTWPSIMNASGPAGDVRHRLHANRCWGVVSAATRPGQPRAANVTKPVAPPSRRQPAHRANATAGAGGSTSWQHEPRSSALRSTRVPASTLSSSRMGARAGSI